MPAQFAEPFGRGILRVSPAHSMRAADGFSDGRADPDELVALAEIDGGEQTVRGNHPLFRDRIIYVVNGERVYHDMIITGAQLRVYENSLLFCASRTIDDELISLMVDRFQADACFEIPDFQTFISTLCQHEALVDLPVSIGPVEYTKTKSSVADLTWVDPFEKAEIYQWQREVRAAWVGGNWPEPRNLEVPACSELVRRIR